MGIKLTCKTKTIYLNFSQDCFSASFHKNWLIRSTRTGNYPPYLLLPKYLSFCVRRLTQGEGVGCVVAKYRMTALL